MKIELKKQYDIGGGKTVSIDEDSKIHLFVDGAVSAWVPPPFESPKGEYLMVTTNDSMFSVHGAPEWTGRPWMSVECVDPTMRMALFETLGARLVRIERRSSVAYRLLFMRRFLLNLGTHRTIPRTYHDELVGDYYRWIDEERNVRLKQFNELVADTGRTYEDIRQALQPVEPPVTSLFAATE